MFNPLVDNLSELKDQEIEEKILELSKKYFQAQRLGKIEMLTQIETFIIMYKGERQKRLIAKKSDLDNDLDQLINVS